MKDKKSEVVVNNPHDAIFKKVMEDKNVVKDLIQNNLPVDIIGEIDLDTLKLWDGSFVSEKLKETFSDVIYGVEVANYDVFIAFLFEHKSYADRLAIFQVGRYMLDLWEKVFQKQGEIPIVFPIIFYHGEVEWNYETDLRKYIKHYDKLPDYMKKRSPTFKHDFITMETHDEDKMYEYKPQTRLFLRSFKFIFSDIEQLVEALLMSVDEMQGEVSEKVIHRLVDLVLFYYRQANKNVTEEIILEQIRKLDGKGAEIVTILEARERKGIEIAKERLALNMLKDGLSVERVAKYAELSVERVEALKNKVN